MLLAIVNIAPMYLEVMGALFGLMTIVFGATLTPQEAGEVELLS
jgi:hypothetical protein